MKKNVLITMSGGTTNVINATLVGIIKAVRKSVNIDRVYAGVPGISGALIESFADLTNISDEQLKLLYCTPASGFVGTTRVKPLEDLQMRQLDEIFQTHNIQYFINIGGNGTIKQSKAISDYFNGSIKVASVAKTVDNDLGDEAFEKVLYTPGFPSCVNYWRNKVWMMNQENLGACEHDKVLVAQTFGRKTGFLAGCARVGDVDNKVPLVLLMPEDQRTVDEVLTHIDFMIKKHGRAIVVMSEGYDVGDIGEKYDLSGQIMYGTSKTTAAQLLVNHCTQNKIQARAFIPGFDQRSDINFVTSLDLERAMIVGKKTIEWLDEGYSSFLGSICRDHFDCKNVGYTKVSFEDIDDYSRQMPDKWILRGGFDVTQDYVEYVNDLLDDNIVELQKFKGELKFAESLSDKIIRRLMTVS